MKIRQGFVSNSSSTSFCIYGAKVNSDTLDDKTFLQFYYGDPNGDDRSCYLGLSYISMKEDETKEVFKNRIEKEIKRLYGEDTSCNTYEESYYNG